MKTDTHFWSYIAQFFVELEILQSKVVHQIKTQFYV
jgi:hypothetical protein